MLDKQRVRPILLAGAIAGFGGLALIGGAQPAAAQYNPYCTYPNYDPYYCQVYGSYAYDYPSYDYGYDYPYGGGLAFGFGGWERSLFGDMAVYGSGGVRIYTRLKAVTARWPTGMRASAEYVMRTMR